MPHGHCLFWKTELLRLYIIGDGFTAIAYCQLGLKKIVGIATEPLASEYRTYDTMVLNSVRFENHDELAERFEASFKGYREVDITEYDEIGKPNEPL